MSGDSDPKQSLDAVAKLKQGIQVSNDEFPMEATPRERRRFALLKAAATMIAGHWPYVAPKDLIDTAEALLAEIESREE